MLRVAFTSCSRIEYCDPQPAWGEIADRKPDVLVLLGDTAYMSRSGDHDELDRHYKAQLAEPGFKALIDSGIPVLATWDDHDFGPDDAWGTELPEAYRRRSLELFMAHMSFRTTQDPDRIYTAWTKDDVHFIVLDTRSFRERPLSSKQRWPGGRADATLLGQAQEDWLFAELDKTQGVTVLCSSSCINQGAPGHTLEEFAFYRRLRARLAAKRNVIVLSGDIHRNHFIDHGGFYEAISSGVGITKEGANGRRYKVNNHGLLHIGAERVDVELRGRQPGKEYIARSIRRSDWATTGSRLARARR